MEKQSEAGNNAVEKDESYFWTFEVVATTLNLKAHSLWYHILPVQV